MRFWTFEFRHAIRYEPYVLMFGNLYGKIILQQNLSK